MVGWYKVLQLTHGEKTLGKGVASTHELGPNWDQRIDLDLTIGWAGWTDFKVYQQPARKDLRCNFKQR